MKFEPGKEVETDEAAVEVDPLPAGKHRFRLVVVNQKGRSSAPFEFPVTVLPRFIPVPP
jgi:acyl dehydratase